AEADGQPDPNALGDNNAGANDEDGVIFNSPLIAGQAAGVTVTASVAGYVNAFIDLDQDKNWTDAGERVLNEAAVTAGPNTLTFLLPAGAKSGDTFCRVRFSTEKLIWNIQKQNRYMAKDGEVEDYKVTLIDSTEGVFDFGDAPSTYGNAGHLLGHGPWLGGLSDDPDAESSSRHDPVAEGDDQDGRDDENGLIEANWILGQSEGFFKLELVPGPSGDFSMGCFMDFNGNGSWDPSECFKYHGGWYPMPPGGWKAPVKFWWGFSELGTPVDPDHFFVRFRIYEGNAALVTPAGAADSGEVEDYLVKVKTEGDPVPPGAVIFGTKWEDRNGDKTWDAAEPVLPGWEIWLDANQNGVEDAGDQYDVTDASGEFAFYGLSAGQYVVAEKMQAGWTQTWPGGSGVHVVTADPSKPSLGILFGNRRTESGTGIGALKWSQPPLFDPMSEDTAFYVGWGENAVYSDSLLADDWFCHDPRPVTSIRWWGSYAEWDSLVPPPVAPGRFHIGIWTDVPGNEETEFSHPGEMIREWIVDRSNVHETAVKKHFYPESMEDSAMCFRYHFAIRQEDWFHQEGDSTVYWLSVAPVYETVPDSNFWGWLTRRHYFNDDAVRVLHPAEPHPGALFEMGFPFREFMDLAFELGTDEYENIFDFGDAPDLGYGTTLIRNGPHHLFDPGVHLGEWVDPDTDGQPDDGALGDDEDGGADEDGITFLNDLVPGGMAGIQVSASTDGFLNAWIDFNQDRQWTVPVERIFSDFPLSAGTSLLEFPVPGNAISGGTLARFRFSTWPGILFRGFAADGEVEDYRVSIGKTGMQQPSSQIPEKYDLYQNYPNPFNPCTQVCFEIPDRGRIEVAVYNMKGSRIRTLLSGIAEPGMHAVTWDGRDQNRRQVPSGLYFCRMEAKGYQKTIKMLFMK
ncbi:hypothetical protein JW906_08350, partial [bacterium]|nr:hypothetical protein [bacterium]